MRGFSIIELIMVIIIISISFMAVPTVLQVSSNAVDSIDDAKASIHAVSKVEIILNKAWDEENVDDLELDDKYYVLSTDESDSSGDVLYCDNKLRNGHYGAKNRRMCEVVGGVNKSATSIGADSGESNGYYDDTDDFNGLVDYIDENGDGVNEFKIKISIDYINYQDSNNIALQEGQESLNTTNIKRIKVEIYDNNTNKFISRYYYYATNIGLPKPYIKENI